MDAVKPALAAAAMTVVALSAQAQNDAAQRVRSLAASCAGCHGTDGHAIAGSAVPRLAGASAAQTTRVNR